MSGPNGYPTDQDIIGNLTLRKVGEDGRYGNLTVEGTINGELAPVFNVVTDGARGDGTTDDTAAIQTTIDKASAAGGGIVYIPEGTYKLTSALTLQSNLTVRGAGVAATVLQQTSTSANGLEGSNLELVTLEDFMVDGPASGTGVGINLDGTVIIYQFYINITRVMVRQFGSHGILLDDPVTSVLTNVTSKENGGEGFYIQCSDLGTVGTSTSLIGCYSHNNTSGNGFRLYNMVYSVLHACASDHNINGYKIESCEAVILTGCGAEENTGDSIQIQGGNNISVFGAWLSESGTNGVHVTSSARQVTLKGIKEFSSGGATSFIDVDSGCSQVTIENCLSDTLPNSIATGTTQVLPAADDANAAGFAAWNYDPIIISAGAALTAGTIYFAKVPVYTNSSISAIRFTVTTAAGSATASQNWIAIYNSSGTRVAQASLDSLITSTGFKSATFTAVTLIPGEYTVHLVVNPSSGTVNLGSGAANAQARPAVNGMLPAASLRAGTNGTSQTTLPSSTTPGSYSTSGAIPFWVALS